MMRTSRRIALCALAAALGCASSVETGAPCGIEEGPDPGTAVCTGSRCEPLVLLREDPDRGCATSGVSSAVGVCERRDTLLDTPECWESIATGERFSAVWAFDVDSMEGQGYVPCGEGLPACP